MVGGWVPVTCRLPYVYFHTTVDYSFSPPCIPLTPPHTTQYTPVAAQLGRRGHHLGPRQRDGVPAQRRPRRAAPPLRHQPGPAVGLLPPCRALRARGGPPRARARRAAAHDAGAQRGGRLRRAVLQARLPGGGGGGRGLPLPDHESGVAAPHLLHQQDGGPLAPDSREGLREAPRVLPAH